MVASAPPTVRAQSPSPSTDGSRDRNGDVEADVDERRREPPGDEIGEQAGPAIHHDQRAARPDPRWCCTVVSPAIRRPFTSGARPRYPSTGRRPRPLTTRVKKGGGAKAKSEPRAAAPCTARHATRSTPPRKCRRPKSRAPIGASPSANAHPRRPDDRRRAPASRRRRASTPRARSPCEPESKIRSVDAGARATDVFGDDATSPDVKRRQAPHEPTSTRKTGAVVGIHRPPGRALARAAIAHTKGRQARASAGLWCGATNDGRT